MEAKPSKGFSPHPLFQPQAVRRAVHQNWQMIPWVSTFFFPSGPRRLCGRSPERRSSLGDGLCGGQLGLAEALRPGQWRRNLQKVSPPRPLFQYPPPLNQREGCRQRQPFVFSDAWALARAQRAWTAFRACSERSSLDKFFARAFPPRRPNSAAALLLCFIALSIHLS